MVIIVMGLLIWLCVYIARKKGYNGWIAGILTPIFPPLVIAVYLLLPKKNAET